MGGRYTHSCVRIQKILVCLVRVINTLYSVNQEDKLTRNATYLVDLSNGSRNGLDSELLLHVLDDLR